MTELERKQERAPVPKDWSYAPAPEARDIVSLRERYGHFVGGEWLEPSETYTTISPATEEPLAKVGQATPAEVKAYLKDTSLQSGGALSLTSTAAETINCGQASAYGVNRTAFRPRGKKSVEFILRS